MRQGGRRLKRWGAVSVLLTLEFGLLGCGGGGETAAPALDHVVDVGLTGGDGRFDYQSIDPDRHLLVIAHLGANQVILFDLRSRSVVATIDDVSDVRGVLAVPSLGRIYATATGSHELVAIDTDERRIVARTEIGSFPDGIAYDPDTQRVFVSDGDAITAVDARSNEVVSTVSLPGGVGNVQADPETGHVFANHQGGSEVVEIDPASLSITRRITLSGCDGNHGLLVDSLRRRAFIACEGNARLITVDLATGKQIGMLATGDGPDVLAFDPARNRLYVAAESGVVSVFATDDNTREIGRLRVAANAHSIAVDPVTHLLYVPLTDGGHGVPVLRIMQPADVRASADR